MSRRIVMFNRVSADGYFAATDGTLGWVIPEPELDKAAEGKLGDADTILFGRRTYELFESFWPHALNDSSTAPDPHSAGRRTPQMAAMAVWINEATKVVFSRTRKGVTWRNSRIVSELDPDEIEAMKRQPGKDMMIFLGSGKSLLSGVPNPMTLDLQGSTTYPSGNVTLRYAPHR